MVRSFPSTCVLVALWWSGDCTGQVPVAQPQRQPTAIPQAPVFRVTNDRVAGRVRLTIDSYEEEYSRALFSACDANADDRLNVLEATQTIESLISEQPQEAFRRVDTNDDGYLSFAEFDREYRLVVQRGGTLRILPARPLPPLRPRTESQDLAAAARLVAIYDTNGDEQLSAREFATLCERRRVLGDQTTLFAGLDTDVSGTLSADELTGFARLPGVALSPDADLGAHSRLPPPFKAADLDQDGALSLGELDRLLRRIDPGLRRWTKTILTSADKSGNGTLGFSELLAALAPPIQVPKSLKGIELTPEQKQLLEEFTKSRGGK